LRGKSDHRPVVGRKLAKGRNVRKQCSSVLPTGGPSKKKRSSGKREEEGVGKKTTRRVLKDAENLGPKPKPTTPRQTMHLQNLREGGRYRGGESRVLKGLANENKLFATSMGRFKTSSFDYHRRKERPYGRGREGHHCSGAKQSVKKNERKNAFSFQKTKPFWTDEEKLVMCPQHVTRGVGSCRGKKARKPSGR